MPRRSEAKKDVDSCEKLRLVANRRLTRRSPNGATRQGHTCQLPGESIAREQQSQGTETSKYLNEKKSKETPLVVASERGPA